MSVLVASDCFVDRTPLLTDSLEPNVPAFGDFFLKLPPLLSGTTLFPLVNGTLKMGAQSVGPGDLPTMTVMQEGLALTSGKKNN